MIFRRRVFSKIRDNIEIKGGIVILPVSKLSKKYESLNFLSFAFFLMKSSYV